MFSELNKVYGSVSTSLNPSSGLGTFEGIATLVANVLVFAAGSISFITLAYGFIQFMMAQGDPKAIEKAQHAVLYSVIAMIATILVYAIRSMVFKAVGADVPAGGSGRVI